MRVDLEALKATRARSATGDVFVLPSAAFLALVEVVEAAQAYTAQEDSQGWADDAASSRLEQALTILKNP